MLATTKIKFPTQTGLSLQFIIKNIRKKVIWNVEENLENEQHWFKIKKWKKNKLI